MPELHPDPDLLERFTRGELAAEDCREIVRHLVAGCPACLTVARRAWASTPAASPEEYDAALARLLDGQAAGLARAAERLAAERQAAPGLLAELLRQPGARRLALVCADGRFRTLPLCELLIGRIRDADPAQPPAAVEAVVAVEAAELALAAAERLSEQAAPPSVIRGVQARAWAWLGNARRLAADLPGAERALATAELLLEPEAAGPLDPLRDPLLDPITEAEVLSLAAQLEADKRQLDQAAARFHRAAALYRATGERHLLGRLLVQKGMALGEEALRQAALGKPAFTPAGWGTEAIAALQDGLRLAVTGLDRPLRSRALTGLICMLLEAQRPEEALAPVGELRRLHQEDGEEDGGGLALVRLRRLEGKVEEGLGRLDAAEAALLEAREGFLREQMGPEAAFVSLELAVIYSRQGRAPELRKLSDDMSAVYLAKDVGRDVVAGLIVFQRLAEFEPWNLAFLIEVAKYLGGSNRVRRTLRPLQWVG